MSDRNYLSFADQNHVVIADQSIEAPKPSDYDDILKLSNVGGAKVVNTSINLRGGNREDAVDIMRGSSYIHLEDCTIGAGNYVFTIKGGARFVSLRNVQISRHGRWPERVDIDIGNFSVTVPDAKTGTVILDNVTATDGRPVRVRVGWAAAPIVIGGNVQVLFWQSAVLKAYVFTMRMLLRTFPSLFL